MYVDFICIYHLVSLSLPLRAPVPEHVLVSVEKDTSNRVKEEKFDCCRIKRRGADQSASVSLIGFGYFLTSKEQ